MACVSNALIVGGGLAGLSAAIALSRVGVRCRVVEIAQQPLGAGLAFSGRAVEALDELGVYEASRAVSRVFGPDTTATTQFDYAGRITGPGPKRPQWPGAKDALGVYRPAFLAVLEGAAFGLGVDVRRGLTIDALEQGSHNTQARFSDGTSESYALVVGADGLRSRTRDLVFPEAPEPAFTGQISIRWMSPGPDVRDEGWYYSPLGRMGFYYLPHQDTVYVPCILDCPVLHHLSDEEVRTRFTELLDSFTAPALVELRSRLTADADLIGRPYFWIMVPGPWHRGRTILIGDAAHATTSHLGMGGGMAVEDAVVLAQCIDRSRSVEQAFEQFMQRRFERVRTVVDASLALARWEKERVPVEERMAMMAEVFQTISRPY